MKVYVCGKWQEKAQVRKVQDYLKSKGHEITFDWTQHDLTEGVSELTEQAICDANGVYQADVLVAVAINPHKYSGMLTEIGIAIGMGGTVYVIGHAIDNNIFVHHPLVHVVEKMENLPL